MQGRSKSAVAALLIVTGAAVPCVGAQATPAPAITNGSRPVTVYVPNSENKAIFPIDVATNVVGAKIPVKAEAESIAITPDGLTAFVTTERTDNAVPVNLTTNTASSRIRINGAFTVAIAPDGKTAYVTKGGGSSVAVVDTLTHALVGNIRVGPSPYGIVITPDGKKAYVADSSVGTVTPIDLPAGTTRPDIPVGPDPRGMAMAPDGKTAYVVSTDDGTVTPIDVATDTAGTPIVVGEFAESMAITPDGKTGFVTRYDDDSGGSVTPLDLATRALGTPIPVPEPRNLAVTPDGKTVYVNGWVSHTVTPIDVATLTAGAPIDVGTGRFTFGIAISPDQAPIAAFSATSQNNVDWSFDASASIAPSSRIVKYRWHFGDGGLQTTRTPFVTHNYTTAGRHKVVLTVTDAAGTSTKQVFNGQTMLRNGSRVARAAHYVTVH